MYVRQINALYSNCAILEKNKFIKYINFYVAVIFHNNNSYYIFGLINLALVSI